MKKYWGILGTVLVALTLAGCGNHSQAKSSDTKKVTTHKVVKKSAPKVKKAAAKTTATTNQGDNTSTEFSNKSFVNTWMQVVSGIFFKDNQFIWKYTARDPNSNTDGKLVVTQGTYSYDSKSQIVTLNVKSQSKTYTGITTQLERLYYNNVEASPANTTLKLKYTPGDMETMTPLDGSFGTVGMENRGTDQTLNYDNINNKFNVQKIDSSMQKGRNTLNSPEDFKQFMVKYKYMEAPAGHSIKASTGNGQIDNLRVFSTDNYQDALSDPENTESEKTVGIKYMLTLEGSGAASDMYVLGDDNNIYYGISELRPDVELSQDADTAYHMYYGN